VRSRLPLAWHEQRTVLGFYLSRPEHLPLAWREQRTVLGFAFARSARLSHRPHPRCGTGISPDRDIAVGCRDIELPCASLPTSLSQQPRSPARTPGFSTYKGRVPARDGLSAGGRWIRTIGPATEKLPFGRAMWFPRTAPSALRGTDPEKDEKFESGFLQRGVKRRQDPQRSP
jgi:hypothetical protein